MSLDQVIGPLVSVTLIELMLVTGLGAELADVIECGAKHALSPSRRLGQLRSRPRRSNVPAASRGC